MTDFQPALQKLAQCTCCSGCNIMKGSDRKYGLFYPLVCSHCNIICANIANCAPKLYSFFTSVLNEVNLLDETDSKSNYNSNNMGNAS